MFEQELGARFRGSMKNWCGIGERPYPLPVWKVWLISRATAPTSFVGVCSLYQQEDDPPTRYWLGWIAVQPAERRKGLASAAINHVLKEALRRGATELWVYTDGPNRPAEQFYLARGFELVGFFHEAGLPQAAATDNCVMFRRELRAR